MEKILSKVEGRYHTTRMEIVAVLESLSKEVARNKSHVLSGGDKDDGHLLVLFSRRADQLLSRAMELRQLIALLKEDPNETRSI